MYCYSQAASKLEAVPICAYRLAVPALLAMARRKEGTLTSHERQKGASRMLLVYTYY